MAELTVKENRIEIIFCDKDVCVCIKPRGVLSEGEGAESLPLLLREQLGGEIYPVHRLDRETDGLMVYARSGRAAAELSRQVADREMKKEYEALLTKRPEKDEAKLCDLLFYDRRAGRSYVVKRERRGVKDAELEYRVIGEENGYCKVRVRLFTGRTHQIRVQFASRGMPLKGDRRYGAPAGGGEMGLTSCYIGFSHPVSGELLEFGKKEEW